MQQGDPTSGHDQVHRNTVSHGDGQQDPRSGAHPAIDPLDLDPAVSLIDSAHLSAMNLVTENYGAEAGHRSPKSEPTIHYLADRLSTPEAQVESSSRLISAAGDPGDNTVTFAPAGDLVTGNCS
jgi:hypothetical protein